MNALALPLPRLRLIPLLTVVCGALLAVYVVLMVTTILFATKETQLGQQVQDRRMELAKLETSYYQAVTRIDSTDPSALGYVTPKAVTYVSQTQMPGFAFAQ